MWRQMNDNCRALLALHKKSAFNRFPKLIFSRLKPMSFAVSHQAFIMKAWNVVDPRMFFWAQRKIDQSERVSTNFTPPYHPSKPFPSIIVFQRACSIPVLAVTKEGVNIIEESPVLDYVTLLAQLENTVGKMTML